MSADPAMGEYLGTGDDLPAGGVFTPLNLQTYHYAGNNPLKYTDPTGRYKERMNEKEVEVFDKYWWTMRWHALGINAARDQALKFGNYMAEQVKKEGGSGSNHNTAPDALRHFYLSSTLGKKLGVDIAGEFLQAHEDGAMGQPRGEKEMDEHNNALGLKFIETNPNASKKQRKIAALRAALAAEMILEPAEYDNENNKIKDERREPTDQERAAMEKELARLDKNYRKEKEQSEAQ